MNEIDVATLHRLLASGRAPRLLDVREAHEYAAGHVPAAVSAPMSRFAAGAGSLDKDAEYLIICQSGNRSATVATWLTQQGYRATNIRGGTFAWQLAGFPVTV